MWRGVGNTRLRGRSRRCRSSRATATRAWAWASSTSVTGSGNVGSGAISARCGVAGNLNAGVGGASSSNVTGELSISGLGSSASSTRGERGRSNVGVGLSAAACTVAGQFQRRLRRGLQQLTISGERQCGRRCIGVLDLGDRQSPTSGSGYLSCVNVTGNADTGFGARSRALIVTGVNNVGVGSSASDARDRRGQRRGRGQRLAVGERRSERRGRRAYAGTPASRAAATRRWAPSRGRA